MKLKAIILLSAFGLMFASCEPEENEIDNFSNDTRDNVTGMWDVVENNQIEAKSTMENYQVEIFYDTTTTSEIVIANFYNLGMAEEAVAIMSGLNLTINSQSIDGFTVNGSGTISSNYKTISLDYLVNDGEENDTVTATYTK